MSRSPRSRSRPRLRPRSEAPGSRGEEGTGRGAEAEAGPEAEVGAGAEGEGWPAEGAGEAPRRFWDAGGARGVGEKRKESREGESYEERADGTEEGCLARLLGSEREGRARTRNSDGESEAGQGRCGKRPGTDAAFGMGRPENARLISASTRTMRPAFGARDAGGSGPRSGRAGALSSTLIDAEPRAALHTSGTSQSLRLTSSSCPMAGTNAPPAREEERWRVSRERKSILQ